MILKKDQIISAVEGSSILSTGGGGSLGYALELVNKICSIELVEIETLEKDDYIFSVFAVGSVSNEDNIDVFLDTIMKAKCILERNVGTKFKAVIPIEIGPCSLAETFYLASLMNIPIIDSDVVGGRCSPELFLETISLDTNIKRCPLLYITKNGISEIINEADPYKLERFLRLISYNYNSYIYVVGYPMKVKDVFNILNKGSISSSISIGKSTGISNKIKAANAEKIFYGKIFSLEKYDINGFLEGYLKIRGLEDFFGKELKIYFRNENLIAWIDERAVVTCPDLISIIDENNLGISNNDLKQHDNVCVLAIPAINLWKTKKGIELFCPRTFGFNIDYIPINK